MKESNHLTYHVQKFFQDYLQTHRGLSSNTVFAYRDAIKLFLAFLSKHTRSHATKLSMDDLSV